jgi:hypothetical protein
LLQSHKLAQAGNEIIFKPTAMMTNIKHNGQKKKDKQRSTKHAHKTKDRVTRTSLKIIILKDK